MVRVERPSGSDGSCDLADSRLVWPALLLVATVVLTLAPPRGVARWVPPVVGGAVTLATGLVDATGALRVVTALAGPLAFLVGAVPLALMLDRIGFFEAVAVRVAGGERLLAGLWWLAAVVTALFNLDAAVVLLTPLYVRLARRRGLDPIPVAFIPVLLASLASSLLPVSNLTNLIVAERLALSAGAFLVQLGLPTLAATTAGWLVYRRMLPPVPTSVVADGPAMSDASLRIGLPVVGFLLVGFTLGDSLGVPAWTVVLIADVVLALRTGRLRPLHLPWQSVLLVTGLAIVAAGTASPLADSVAAGGWSGWMVFVAGVLGANALNNLPALLVGLDAIGPGTADVPWLLLLGVNLGPTLVLSGSLAGLLWADTMRHLDVPVTAARYSWVGIRVGIPAMVSALVVWLLQPW